MYAKGLTSPSTTGQGIRELMKAFRPDDISAYALKACSEEGSASTEWKRTHVVLIF